MLKIRARIIVSGVCPAELIVEKKVQITYIPVLASEGSAVTCTGTVAYE